MKRLSLPFLLLLAAFMFAPALSAQLAPGSWRQYPVFGSVSSITETPGHLWWISGGCLYQYDKDADETRFYVNGVDISDYNIKSLYADPRGRYIAVAYEGGNLDLVSPDGSCTNLPEIKETMAQVDKDINDVRFDGDEMYVSTPFGLVVYNLKRMEVKESGLYGFGIDAVLLTPTHIYLERSIPSAPWDRHRLYMIERGKSIRNIADFEESSEVCESKITDYALIDAEKNLYAVAKHNRFIEIAQVGPGLTYQAQRWLTDPADNSVVHSVRLSVADDGKVLTAAEDGSIYEVDPSAPTGVRLVTRLPQSDDIYLMSALRGLREVWASTGRSVTCYRVDPADGSLTVTSQREAPSDATTFTAISQIFPVAGSRGFFIANRGMNKLDINGSGDRVNVPLQLNRVDLADGVKITEIDPHPVTAVSYYGKQHGPSTEFRILSPGHIAEDPDRPGRLYIASAVEGVHVIEDGREVALFNSSNSPLRLMGSYYGVNSVTIDTHGNLWLGKRANDQVSVMMLPAAKRRQESLASITESDWQTLTENTLKGFNVHLLHLSSGKMTVGMSFLDIVEFIDHAGTPDNLADDRRVGYDQFTDQDGKSFNPKFIYSIMEDKRGQVWIGTSNGVVTVSNPARAFDADFYVNRVKVPRTDGSNLADYLLEADAITCMAADNSNRKWLGTASSGLYLVSENGDKILASYNTSNSPLPSNAITGLYADPGSSSVYVATPSGLYEFSSTSSPARPDFSDVYAYPNPVTPDFSGWVTITGLMDSSLVKIVDSSMALVYQTTSEGGMARWDLCNMAGRRVRSGVYYVVASSGSSDSSSSAGAVACKIMVVN